MRQKYFLAIALIVVGGVIGNLLRFNSRTPVGSPNFSAIPMAFDEYQGREIPINPAEVAVLRADTSTFRHYSGADNSDNGLFVAYFKSQKYGSQIHSPKHCLPGGGWRIESIEPYDLNLLGGVIKKINLLVITEQNYKSVMFYWYETRSGAIRSEYGLKLDLIKNALLLRPTDAAIIRLTVDSPDGNIKSATDKGARFLARAFPYIDQSLPL